MLLPFFTQAIVAISSPVTVAGMFTCYGSSRIESDTGSMATQAVRVDRFGNAFRIRDEVDFITVRREVVEKGSFPPGEFSAVVDAVDEQISSHSEDASEITGNAIFRVPGVIVTEGQGGPDHRFFFDDSVGERTFLGWPYTTGNGTASSKTVVEAIELITAGIGHWTTVGSRDFDPRKMC